MNFEIFTFDELGSTNTEALEQARRGADEGVCIVARRQTSGRGRHGRVWISERDAGLYFSVVLRPSRLAIRFVPLITLMTAVAVHDALEELYSLDCDVKWVNDIHVGGRKICGILAETAETPKGLAVVVGIGINLRSSIIGQEIAQIATSVETETGAPPDREILLQKLTSMLSLQYATLLGDDGPRMVRDAWTRRSSYASGKAVRVVLENETFSGTTRGLEENGALRVELDDGEVRIVHAGDVERMRSF